MIKYTGTRAGRPFIAFGITRGNVERLVEGKPIHVFGEEMNIPFDVVIHYGETEQALLDELRFFAEVPEPSRPGGRG